jgi:hypothetical protein
MGHTPGPWAVGESGFNVYYLNPLIEAGDDNIDDPRHDSVICDTRNIAYPPAYSGIPDEETAANARLIAAAPDLLAALKAITAHDKNGRFGKPDFDAAIRQCRAAIAKATGN